jgi:hypothetical protein
VRGVLGILRGTQGDQHPLARASAGGHKAVFDDDDSELPRRGNGAQRRSCLAAENGSARAYELGLPELIQKFTKAGKASVSGDEQRPATAALQSIHSEDAKMNAAGCVRPSGIPAIGSA